MNSLRVIRRPVVWNVRTVSSEKDIEADGESGSLREMM